MFRIQASRFRANALEFMVSGLSCRVQGLGFCVLCFVFIMYGVSFGV